MVGRFQGQGPGLALGACLFLIFGGEAVIYLHANWEFRGCEISEFRGVRGYREFYVIERSAHWVGSATNWNTAVFLARKTWR